MAGATTIHAADVSFWTIILDFILMNWWWLWIPLFGIIGWIGDQVYNAVNSRREYRLRLAKEMRKAAQAQARAAMPAAPADARSRPKPGPCVHRNVVPVIPLSDSGSTPVAWLCNSCGTRLPADWAVLEEDL